MGYELLSDLTVSGRNGAPLTALPLARESADGVYDRAQATCLPAHESHQEALWAQVDPVEALHLDTSRVPMVAVKPTLWPCTGIVRVPSACVGGGCATNSRCRETDSGCSCAPGQPPFVGSYARPVAYHKQAAHHYLAEQAVVLTRPYIRDRNGKREVLPGPSVSRRLVLSQIRSASGVVLATWDLLTNVSERVDAAPMALWSSWRWQIECFHKRLPSAGWQREDWQQESASAVAKRLAVVSMAAALVWAIQPGRDAEGEPLRGELMRLSGRQTIRSRPVPAPALLAGLWTLLSAVELLERYTPDQLQRLAQQAKTLRGEPEQSV